jgi:uridine kinase
MKIALLISGYSRSFQNNIENLKKNIIQNNDVDIYLHITNCSETKYLNLNINIDNIIKLLNPKCLIVSNNIEFNKKEKNNILNQNYKFFWLNEERKRIEKLENIIYDIVFKIRPDVYLNTLIDFKEIHLNKISIPIDSKIDKLKLNSLEDKYICDIIAFGCPKLMDEYFNFFLELEFLIEKFNTNVNETLLYNYLNDKNISYNLINIEYIVILSLFNTIAITGDSGSGKSTITKILKDIFQSSFVLECDRYHKWERNDENWEKYTHLNPEANYIAKMQNDVFDLKIGKNIYQIDYDHKSGKFTNKELIESKENIIVCGLHTLYLPENILNLKIYMDTDDNLRIPWKIKRDVINRGYSIEKIYKQILDRNNDFEKYIKIQKTQSDIIICLYTDTIFNIENFDINFEANIYLKIGVKSIYSLSNFTDKLIIDKFELVNNFYYLYFKNANNYYEIIKTIILNLK